MSVNESTNWAKKSGVESKYKALGCSIEKVNEQTLKTLTKEIMDANDG